MKLSQNKINTSSKTDAKKSKEIQELQTAWEKTAQKLKNSSRQEDQMIAKFLESNYIHPETGLVTSKFKWSSREISCG